MTKNEVDFDTWFNILQIQLDDRGVAFYDGDAVRDDFEQGKDVHDVVDEIAEE